MQPLNEKIKEAIEISGISQSNLAKKLGISRQHLHDILKANRKSKYLRDLAKILNISKFDEAFFDADLQTQEKKLPILTLEDLQSFATGIYKINHLYKPFYKEWPFYETNLIASHFCLRLPQEFAYNLNTYPLASFRFYLPLELKAGSILIIYCQNLHKVTVGSVEVNPDTGARFLVNEHRIDPIGQDTLIMAECTQLINLFE